MNEIRIRAYAKINLGLDVLGRRENGYHDVSMVMQTISLHDLVRIQLQEEPGIRITSNWKFLPTDGSNLAYKAAAAMYKKAAEKRGCFSEPDSAEAENSFYPGVSIYLEKHIPAAAGMAGGSTDCAAVLKAMNVLLDLQLTTQELMEIGVTIGADVPYCVCGGTMLAEGIGEKLSPLAPMPNCFILTATPEISVSTKMIYEAIDSVPREEPVDIGGICEGLQKQDLLKITSSMDNLMERVTADMHPEVTSIRKIMEENGALRAMMSGSGPTVFGIFRLRSEASRAAAALEKAGLVRTSFISVPCNKVKY